MHADVCVRVRPRHARRGGGGERRALQPSVPFCDLWRVYLEHPLPILAERPLRSRDWGRAFLVLSEMLVGLNV